MPKSVKFDEDATEHIREIIGAVQAEIVISRELRETSSNLRQENAELREMLRENMLTCLSSRIPWTNR